MDESNQDIPLEVKAKVGIGFFKFAVKVATAVIPIIIAFGVWAKTSFENYMEERDIHLIESLTDGISGETIFLERLELKAYREADSLMYAALIHEHWLPAKEQIIETLNEVKLANKRIENIEDQILINQTQISEVTGKKKSVLELELEWYKAKEKRDEKERDINAAALDLQAAKDKALIQEMQDIRRLIGKRKVKATRSE